MSHQAKSVLENKCLDFVGCALIWPARLLVLTLSAMDF